MVRGLKFSICWALVVFSEESLGRFAANFRSLDNVGDISVWSRLKVWANSMAKSYRLMRVAPQRWQVPVSLRSAASRVIWARLVFRVGELYWSVKIFRGSLFFSLLYIQRAKLIFPAAGVAP